MGDSKPRLKLKPSKSELLNHKENKKIVILKNIRSRVFLTWHLFSFL